MIQLGICDKTTLTFSTTPFSMHLILTFSLFSYISITGNFDVGPLNKLRTFLSYPHCRESLDLVTGKTYLIMGTSRDFHRDEQE